MVLGRDLEVDWLNTLKKEGVTQLARLAATGLEVAASEPKIFSDRVKGFSDSVKNNEELSHSFIACIRTEFS